MRPPLSSLEGKWEWHPVVIQPLARVTVYVVRDHPDGSTSPLGTDTAETGLDNLKLKGKGRAEGKGHSHPKPQTGDALGVDEAHPKPATDHQ